MFNGVKHVPAQESAALQHNAHVSVAVCAWDFCRPGSPMRYSPILFCRRSVPVTAQHHSFERLSIQTHAWILTWPVEQQSRPAFCQVDIVASTRERYCCFAVSNTRHLLNCRSCALAWRSYVAAISVTS
eukprot:362744-Chlamydomonas_euryale.AAC.4